MTPEIKVLLYAMTPMLELKLAIPLGISMGLSSISTFIYATIGALIPPAIGFALAPYTTNLLMKHSPVANKYLTKLFQKTRKEHNKKFQRYGSLLIIGIIAIPLPGSGAGTGTLIAFIFGIDYWKGMFFTIIGTAIAATLLLTGINSINGILQLIF